MTVTVGQILQSGTERLNASGADANSLDVCAIVAHVLKCTRLDLFTDRDRELSEDEVSTIESYISRRCAAEPLAYILGEKEFWGLTFNVTPDVLIPRPDTETLVATLEAVLPNKDEAFKFADLGTGSGALLVAILHQYPHSNGVAVDVSDKALNIAKGNAQLNNVADRAQFVKSHWLNDVDDSFTIIVSNPPYIRPDVIQELDAGVKDFEPMLALDGGVDGLDCYREIIAACAEKLHNGGLLLLEIGYDQQESLTQLFEQAGYFTNIKCLKDYGGNDRVMMALKAE